MVAYPNVIFEGITFDHGITDGFNDQIQEVTNICLRISFKTITILIKVILLIRTLTEFHFIPNLH